MLIHLKSVDSTNNYIEKNALPAGTIVWADSQTAGRGRGSHSFSSPEGGIYFSCLFKEGKETSNGHLSPNDSNLLTPKAALAVCMALEEICRLEPRIKWVNDVFLEGKKVCGILCEHIGNKYIVGIGINTSAERLPEELKQSAGGIGDVPKRIIIKRISELLFSSMTDAGILSGYSRRLGTLGRMVSFLYEGEERTGTVTGINESCNLVIQTDSGIVTLSSGEIMTI